jgi:uncharacterized integral membrane protein
MASTEESTKPVVPGGAKPAGGATPTAPTSHGPGVVRKTTNTVKRVFLVALGALVALFAVFNSQNVEVKWIFGDPIQTPLILAIAVTFIAGAIIGWLVAKVGGRSHDA